MQPFAQNLHPMVGTTISPTLVNQINKHMKKIYSSILFILIGALASNMNAQNTCSTPYPFVTSTSSTYTAVSGSVPNTDLSNNYGCFSGLSSSGNDVTWIYVGICTAGDINIDMTPTGAGLDLDFVAWGPLTAGTDCGLTAGQIIDCSISTSVSETVHITAALPGEFYKIMISNFGGGAGTINLTTATGTTGSACVSTLYSCPGTIPTQQICQVTTDPTVNHNIIIWNKDTATYTASYYLQKETTTMGVYATIATVLNHDTSAYEDLVSNPMIQSFKYRIATTDSCGLGTMVYGPPHRTIHLLTSVSSSTGYPQLNWNNYYGFSYGTYFIYRGASPTTLTMYDSISASFNSYTDVAAVPGMNYYGVAVFPPSPCQPSRMMNMKSLSNVSPVNFTGIDEHEFANLSVGPNPANDVLNFNLGNISANFTADMIDITGRIVLSKSFKNVSQETIDVSTISNGSYVVRFSSDNGTTHKNIIIAR
jgi:hypothetical protein